MPGDQPVDGVDLRPVLEGSDVAHDVLHFDAGFQWAVRTPEWKLRWADPNSSQVDAISRTQHTDVGPGLSLVRIGADSDESVEADVSALNPGVVAELTA